MRLGENPKNRTESFFLAFLEEVTDYLDRRSRARLQQGIAEIVHSFTDGHPGGVALIVDFIMEKGGPRLTPSALRRILDRLPADPDQRWAELVRLILDAIQEPRLRRAVDAVALMTTFDAPLLSQLIGTDDTQGSDIGEVISKLRGLRLLQQVRDLSGEPSDRFRLHEFIRLSVAARLRTLDPQRWLEVHRVASQHYFRLLRQWEGEPYDSYGAWYRFEDTGSDLLK
jgi:ATP/maltotriose-dependent transcriptional regulator MalT